MTREQQAREAAKYVYKQVTGFGPSFGWYSLSDGAKQPPIDGERGGPPDGSPECFEGIAASLLEGRTSYSCDCDIPGDQRAIGNLDQILKAFEIAQREVKQNNLRVEYPIVFHKDGEHFRDQREGESDLRWLTAALLAGHAIGYRSRPQRRSIEDVS